MLTSRIIVYSDLNCPFCFVLNEWLETNEQAMRIRWQGVEHMPELAAGRPLSSSQSELLTSEVTQVRERAPDVSIERPPTRPNTLLAISILLAIEENDPETSAKLRTCFFRALWQRGLDLSDPAILNSLIRSCGVDPKRLPAPDFKAASAAFSEWNTANYRRIPVLSAPTGAVYLGLGDSHKLDVFMGSALFDSQGSGSCFPS